MTMSNEVVASLVIAARDRVSAQFRKIGEEAGKLSQIFGVTRRGLLALISSLTTLQLALIAIPPLFGAMVTTQTAVGMLEFERSTRRARIQLQLYGLSTQDAAEMVGILNRQLDRSSAISLFNSQQALEAVAVAGSSLTATITTMAEKMSFLTGAPISETTVAAFDLIVGRDPSTFAGLAGSWELIGSSVGVTTENINKMTPDQVITLINTLHDIEEDEVKNVERLSEALFRLNTLTLPTREAFTEFSAGLSLIVVSTLVENLENFYDDLEFIAAMTTLGSIAGTKFIGGFRGAIVAAFLTLFTGAAVANLETSFETLGEDLAGSLIVLGAAGALGAVLGGRLTQAFILTATLLFLPGIVDMIADLETEEKIINAALLVGGVIGLKMLSGFRAKFLLAGLVLELMQLFAGEESPEMKGTVAAAAAIGGAIGAAFGGPVGLVIGATIGLAITQLLDMLGLLDPIVTTISQVIDRILNKIRELVDAITSMGDILKKLNMPRLDPHKGFEPGFLGDIPSSIGEGIIEGVGGLLGFDSGGVVPGKRGSAQLVVAHGGETIIPTHKMGGGAVQINLVLGDGTKIAEAVFPSLQSMFERRVGLVT